ncbi:hypothetical protein GW17_00022389 [Ensete ventricosum]|nr:hypothetical protein GW17_00022389 [Ensete ventricosum]RZS11311.1 hypothetical protein BHM03_00042627 [Ensete ventricosum]
MVLSQTRHAIIFSTKSSQGTTNLGSSTLIRTLYLQISTKIESFGPSVPRSAKFSQEASRRSEAASPEMSKATAPFASGNQIRETERLEETLHRAAGKKRRLRSKPE